uniref:PAP_central domain-containing protein n=1 Tax=Meloidogyne hapla TaxID=6305 RepID=A0A1I8BZ96_MELHA
MFNLEEKDKIDEWVNKVENRVEDFKQMKEQIELDSNKEYLNPYGFQSLSLKEDLQNSNEDTEIKVSNKINIKSNDPMEMIKEEYDIESLINKVIFPNKIKIKNPKEYFKTIFDNWIDFTKNNNFGLLMASPYNKLGGNIKGIVVAIGKGKGEEEEKIKAKQIFNGEENTFCEQSFMINCSDNSLFCYICKKSVHDSFTNVRRSSSSDKIHFEIEGTENWQFSLRINKKQNEEEKQLKSMTIYTPTYPELSITAKITKSTEKIILDAFIKGLEKTMNIRLLNKE